MSATTRSPISHDECAEHVGAYFLGLLERLEAHHDEIAAAFAEGAPEPGTITELVAPIADEFLEDPTVAGAGFIAVPDAIQGRHLYMAWWQGDERLRLPDSLFTPPDVFDYTRQEWFKVTAGERRRYVTGPFVDYVCTDESVLTTSIPVELDGRTVGILGTDTLLEDFERLMMPRLRAAKATIVNRHHRVVLSWDPGLFSGERVDISAFTAQTPCGDLPLTVLS